MVRINREYLDSALGAINLHTEAAIENYKSRNAAAHSASQAVADGARANLFWRMNISRGIMIGSILVGFGLMVALVLVALPGLITALKLPANYVTHSSTFTNEQVSDVVDNSTLRPTQSGEPGLTDVSETPIPAVIVPTQSRDTSSIRCIQNGSFDAPCMDTMILQNGATFSGSWRDGAANGEGTISFNDGGSITGVWAEGALIEILGVTAPEVSSSITRSVTFFSSVSAGVINDLFEEVVTGHIFKTPNDPNWSNAYCYLKVNDGLDSITVKLSDAPNFNAQISLDDYIQNDRFSRSEFERAQQICSYQYTNF